MEPVLDEILDLPRRREERRLAAMSATDPELAAAVRAFLAAADRVEADGFLARPVGETAAELLDHATRDDAPESRLGQRLGAWELTGILGEGGMGVVYAARRADGQYQAEAAVKLMMAMDPESPLRHRLLAERQILAGLDDPRIARLLDGGVSADGHPFLVMERVEGRSILDHCEAGSLGLEARLQLVAEICGAVHAAHQRLVLHCDLKPSNILVTPRGELKLLDFGVARSLDGAASPEAPLTRYLTPGYASPEQLAGEVLTPASDVYSLGKVLRELVDGDRPWAQRVRGDLAQILSRATAVAPADRYASAADLADDIGRWRRRLPVSAVAPTAGYRFRRLVSRHRMLSAALAAVALAVVVGVTGTAWQAHIAARERDQARREAVRSSTVSAFLTDLFQSADPNLNHGADVTVREILERGRARIEALEGEPAERASLLSVMGRVYYRLGEYEVSRDLYAAELDIERRLRPPDPAGVSDTRIDLAVSLLELGDVEAAADQIDSCLAYREAHPREDPSWLTVPISALARIASGRRDDVEAVRLFGRVLSVLDPQEPALQQDLGRTWSNYGVSLARLGRLTAADSAYAAAETHYGRSDQDVPSHLGALYANWALTSHQLGRLEQAEAQHLRALELRRGLRHNRVDIATSLINLGNLLVEQGRAAEALPLLEEALSIQRAAFGDTHLYVAAAEINLGHASLALGDPEAADVRYRQGETIFRELYGDDSPALAVTLGRRARAARACGALAAADSLLNQAVAMHRRHLPNSQRQFGEALLDLAELDALQGRDAQAAAAAAEAVAVLLETVGETHALTIRARAVVARYPSALDR
ncbi:MAG: serine/threonine-protein kinase [Candidatus Krumholzibacteriia bacterium]